MTKFNIVKIFEYKFTHCDKSIYSVDFRIQYL